MEALSGTIIRALLSIVVLFVFIRVVPPSEIINADYSRKRINVKQIILLLMFKSFDCPFCCCSNVGTVIFSRHSYLIPP